MSSNSPLRYAPDRSPYARGIELRPAPSPPPPVRYATPPPSRVAPETAGAAQFLTNLSDRQRAHLQYAVHPDNEGERYSQFLEGPRKMRVPERFTFDSPNSDARRLHDSGSIVGVTSRLGRGDTKMSIRSGKSSIRHEHGKSEGETEIMNGKGGVARSKTASSLGSMKAASVDLIKEVEQMKENVVDLLDWNFYAMGLCLCLLNLIMAWDATSISISLSTIAYALEGSAIQCFWLGISFLVGATAFIPLFSAFSDIFGRKAMLLTGVAFFTVGSLIAAVAGTFTGIHFGRSVQGIGAGGVFLLSDLIASDLISPLDRRRLSSILGAMWAIGAVTGPAIGEALAKRNQWRWIFWINLPFCVLSLTIISVFARLRGPTSGSIIAKLRRFDWVGFVLLGGSLVPVLLGLSWGGTVYRWNDPRTLLPLQFGILGIVMHCVWSWYSPFWSVLSLEGSMNRTSLCTYFGTMIQGMVIGAFLYIMPFFFLVAKVELDDLPTGVRWFAWTLPLVTMILLTFIIISRWNYWLVAIWLGWFLVLLGVALTTLFGQKSPTAAWVCIAMVSGAGLGILYPSLHTAAELIAATNDDKSRQATTNFAFAQTLGKTLGVTVASSIFGNELLRNLKSNPIFEKYARAYAANAVRLVVRIRATPGGEGSAKMQITDAYVDSFKTVWTVLAVLVALAFVISWFTMPRESPGRGDDPERVTDTSYVV